MALLFRHKLGTKTKKILNINERFDKVIISVSLGIKRIQQDIRKSGKLQNSASQAEGRGFESPFPVIKNSLQ